MGECALRSANMFDVAAPATLLQISIYMHIIAGMQERNRQDCATNLIHRQKPLTHAYFTVRSHGRWLYSYPHICEGNVHCCKLRWECSEMPSIAYNSSESIVSCTRPCTYNKCLVTYQTELTYLCINIAHPVAYRAVPRPLRAVMPHCEAIKSISPQPVHSIRHKTIGQEISNECFAVIVIQSLA